MCVMWSHFGSDRQRVVLQQFDVHLLCDGVTEGDINAGRLCIPWGLIPTLPPGVLGTLPTVVGLLRSKWPTLCDPCPPEVPGRLPRPRPPDVPGLLPSPTTTNDELSARGIPRPELVFGWLLMPIPPDVFGLLTAFVSAGDALTRPLPDPVVGLLAECVAENTLPPLVAGRDTLTLPLDFGRS